MSISEEISAKLDINKWASYSSIIEKFPDITPKECNEALFDYSFQNDKPTINLQLSQNGEEMNFSLMKSENAKNSCIISILKDNEIVIDLNDLDEQINFKSNPPIVARDLKILSKKLEPVLVDNISKDFPKKEVIKQIVKEEIKTLNFGKKSTDIKQSNVKSKDVKPVVNKSSTITDHFKSKVSSDIVNSNESKNSKSTKPVKTSIITEKTKSEDKHVSKSKNKNLFSKIESIEEDEDNIVNKKSKNVPVKRKLMIDSDDDEENVHVKVAKVEQPVHKAKLNPIKNPVLQQTVHNTFEDDDGFLVTKTQTKKLQVASNESKHVKPPITKLSVNPVGMTASNKAKTKQPNILSFFTKK